MSDYEKIKEMLETHEKRLQKIEAILFSKEFEIPQVTANILDKIAKGFDLNIDLTQKLVDVEKEDFTIITSIPGNTQDERQINGVLLILAINYYGYNRDTIKSTELKAKLIWLGINLNNFSRSMRSIQGKIIPRGKPKSKEFEYKITLTGLEEAQKLVNSILI